MHADLSPQGFVDTLLANWNASGMSGVKAEIDAGEAVRNLHEEWVAKILELRAAYAAAGITYVCDFHDPIVSFAKGGPRVAENEPDGETYARYWGHGQRDRHNIVGRMDEKAAWYKTY